MAHPKQDFPFWNMHGYERHPAAAEAWLVVTSSTGSLVFDTRGAMVNPFGLVLVGKVERLLKGLGH